MMYINNNNDQYYNDCYYSSSPTSTTLPLHEQNQQYYSKNDVLKMNLSQLRNAQQQQQQRIVNRAYSTDSYNNDDSYDCYSYASSSSSSFSDIETEQYIAMDCEMVGVGPNGKQSSVARVTLVGYDGNVIFDEFVRQSEPVTDYRTWISGVTADDVENATYSFEECRSIVREYLRGKILIGHGLINDLRVLDLTHPWQDTRDTAKYEPFMKYRNRFPGDNQLFPRKLKELAYQYLNWEIQRDGEAHSPIDDAIAPMELYKMMQFNWDQVMDYKVKQAQMIQQQYKQQQQQEQYYYDNYQQQQTVYYNNTMGDQSQHNMVTSRAA